MSIEKNRNLMENQVKRLKGKVNESKAPRELKKHLGKTVKDFKYDYDGDSHYLTTVFTDGTEMTITAYGEYEDTVGMGID
jgi:hypothetical protein